MASVFSWVTKGQMPHDFLVFGVFHFCFLLNKMRKVGFSMRCLICTSSYYSSTSEGLQLFTHHVLHYIKHVITCAMAGIEQRFRIICL